MNYKIPPEKRKYIEKLIQQKQKEFARERLKFQTTSYLYLNKKLKKSVILKKLSFKKITYPFSLNIKLITEFLKKK